MTNSSETSGQKNQKQTPFTVTPSLIKLELVDRWSKAIKQLWLDFVRCDLAFPTSKNPKDKIIEKRFEESRLPEKFKPCFYDLRLFFESLASEAGLTTEPRKATFHPLVLGWVNNDVTGQESIRKYKDCAARMLKAVHEAFLAGELTRDGSKIRNTSIDTNNIYPVVNSRSKAMYDLIKGKYNLIQDQIIDTYLEGRLLLDDDQTKDIAYLEGISRRPLHPAVKPVVQDLLTILKEVTHAFFDNQTNDERFYRVYQQSDLYRRYSDPKTRTLQTFIDDLLRKEEIKDLEYGFRIVILQIKKSDWITLLTQPDAKIPVIVPTDLREIDGVEALMQAYFRRAQKEWGVFVEKFKAASLARPPKPALPILSQLVGELYAKLDRIEQNAPEEKEEPNPLLDPLVALYAEQFRSAQIELPKQLNQLLETFSHTELPQDFLNQLSLYFKGFALAYWKDWAPFYAQVKKEVESQFKEGASVLTELDALKEANEATRAQVMTAATRYLEKLTTEYNECVTLFALSAKYLREYEIDTAKFSPMVIERYKKENPSTYVTRKRTHTQYENPRSEPSASRVREPNGEESSSKQARFTEAKREPASASESFESQPKRGCFVHPSRQQFFDQPSAASSSAGLFSSPRGTVPVTTMPMESLLPVQPVFVAPNVSGFPLTTPPLAAAPMTAPPMVLSIPVTQNPSEHPLTTMNRDIAKIQTLFEAECKLAETKAKHREIEPEELEGLIATLRTLLERHQAIINAIASVPDGSGESYRVARHWRGGLHRRLSNLEATLDELQPRNSRRPG